jgi:outer membrane protein assembly factor BamB
MRLAYIGACVAALLSLSACSTASAWWDSDQGVSGDAGQPAGKSSPARELTQLWRANLDQRRPASPAGGSTPFIIQVGGVNRVAAGAQDRRLRIYDMDGSELSRTALGASCNSGGVQLQNGLIVVGDAEGVLYAINPATGQIAWRRSLSSSIMSAPIKDGDDVIVQTADNRIYKLTQQGEKLWSYIGSSGGLSMQLSPSPVVWGGHVYAVFSNGDVVSVKSDSGSLLWKRQLLFNTEAVVLSELKVPVATPTIIPAAQSGRDEDTLAVAVFQGEVVFLSMKDGTDFLRRSLSLKSSPLMVGKRLFVADASGAVSALDAASGDTWWRSEISAGALVGPVVWQDALWVADTHGEVFRLNFEGELIGSLNLPGRIDHSPVVAPAGIVVRNDLGDLFMLR